MNPACLTAFAASTKPTETIVPPAPQPPKPTVLQSITPYIPWFARTKNESTTSLRSGVEKSAEPASPDTNT